jgi:5-formyltetrahydrofolate cyclo-ligase
MMSPSSIADAKASMRKDALARRASLSLEWRAQASADMARHAASVLALGPGGPIAGYWPIRSEADPLPLLQLASRFGRATALPVVRHPALLFRRFIEGVELVDAGFGTMGPDATADEVRPAILIVPLAAYDDHGHRLGYGQGHYDRTISAMKRDGLPLLTLGIAFSQQKVTALPIEPHDIPLDHVVTEQGLERFR